MCFVAMLQTRRRLVTVVDHVLDSFQDVPSSLGWAKEFNNGLSPVEEEAVNIPLSVKSGLLPSDLAGAYLRIGPNAQHWPPSKRTHAFDGDGMVHTVRIIDGSATYNSAYLQTPRYKFEKEFGQEWFTRVGEMTGVSGLIKILALGSKKAHLAGLEDWEAGSLANTAVGFTPDGKLWALHEMGPPFRFVLDKTGVPKSLEFDTLLGTHQKPMSAHPKFDYQTGEILFHGRNLQKAEFYFGRAISGKITDKVDLKMENGFHHDMFITEKYAVIVDGSTRFDPKGVVQGKPLWLFKKEQKLRFGIFPRSCQPPTAENFIWIEADVPGEIVHTLCAYDEDGKIILWAPMGDYQEGKLDGILGEIGEFRMRRFVIDVNAQKVVIQDIPGAENYSSEFPRIRDDRVGVRVRCGFSGYQVDGIDFNFKGILKWDFEDCRLAGAINFSDGVIGGEPVFFPRCKHTSSDDDDNGYIGMFLWNQNSKESTFALFDAKTFSSTPVAELSVPRRVPLGFHAHWITEEQFQQQLITP